MVPAAIGHHNRWKQAIPGGLPATPWSVSEKIMATATPSPRSGDDLAGVSTSDQTASRRETFITHRSGVADDGECSLTSRIGSTVTGMAKDFPMTNLLQH